LPFAETRSAEVGNVMSVGWVMSSAVRGIPYLFISSRVYLPSSRLAPCHYNTRNRTNMSLAPNSISPQQGGYVPSPFPSHSPSPKLRFAPHVLISTESQYRRNNGRQRSRRREYRSWIFRDASAGDRTERCWGSRGFEWDEVGAVG
jgi:hypothetical protein